MCIGTGRADTGVWEEAWNRGAGVVRRMGVPGTWPGVWGRTNRPWEHWRACRLGRGGTVLDQGMACAWGRGVLHAESCEGLRLA